MMPTTYSVECLRYGQPRPYADHLYEYVITCAMDGKPWLMGGDIEKNISSNEADRKAGRLMGGSTPEGIRKVQHDWAVKIARALAMGFYEKTDKDECANWASAYLQSLTLDATKGTIRLVVTSAYTD